MNDKAARVMNRLKKTTEIETNTSIISQHERQHFEYAAKLRSWLDV